MTFHKTILCVFGLACFAWVVYAAEAPTQPAKKPTLAVLPFVPLTGDADEQSLAKRMRLAVSQKLSADSNAAVAGGVYDRLDNVRVDDTISALDISLVVPAAGLADDSDVQKVLAALDTQWTIAGAVKGRRLSLTLYEGIKIAKTASVEIPPDNESPKLAVEKILTDLTGVAFAHIREVEADHSDPQVEARFAARPNLVADPLFALAAKGPKKIAANWEAILGAARYPPPLIMATEALNLAQDRVAIVPRSAAGLPGASSGPPGYCLMMRMSKTVAESNGLACESTWIPIEDGQKYRFAARYHSSGPVAHIFLKGFNQNADAFGDKKDPDATRREAYRAQVLPRKQNATWDLIEMDFAPSRLKATEPKIQWLRVDLYVYLVPGDIFFDNIVVKKISE